ncbi:MAG: DMT family transporter [bacterium]|nr:DMT family transporter [bacterium]
MTWQISILLHSLLAAYSVIIVKKLSSKGNKYVYSVLFFSFLAEWLAGIIFVKIFLEDRIILDWDPIIYSQLLAGGVLFGLVNFLAFEVYKHLSASVGSISMASNRIAVVLMAVIFLNEKLTFIQVIGIIIMLGAIVLATYKKSYKNVANNAYTYFILIVAAFAYGFATINEKDLLDKMGVANYLVLGWGFQVLAVSSLVLLRRKKWLLPDRSTFIPFISLVLLFGVSGGLFITSLVGSDSSSITVSLAGLKVILSVILAYILLKERSNFRRLLASSCLSFLGIILLLS